MRRGSWSTPSTSSKGGAGRPARLTPFTDGLRPSALVGAEVAVCHRGGCTDGPVLGNAVDVNFGLSGMGRLAGDLRDTSTRSGWVRRFGEPSRTRYAAARLADCLTTSYTTDGATRPLYAEFLREASAAVAAPGLVEAAAAHEGQAVALVRKSLRS